MSDLVRTLSDDDRAFIAEACAYLENPSFLMRAADTVGKPAELLLKSLPRAPRERINQAAEAALRSAAKYAVSSLGDGAELVGSVSEVSGVSGKKRLHNIAVAVSGAVGGAFSWPGLIVELPVTTTTMLRAIASVARDFGEDTRDPETILECLTVFAHGSTEELGAMESTYYAFRAGLTDATVAAARFVAGTSQKQLTTALEKQTAPALVRFITQVAARFKVVVTHKGLTQAVPLLGAVTGASVNVAFNDHFVAVARYHFGLRRLEREVGKPTVRQVYDEALSKLR